MPGSPDDHDPTHPAILPEHHPPPLPGHYRSLSHASTLTPKNLFEYHVLSGDHKRYVLLCSKKSARRTGGAPCLRNLFPRTPGGTRISPGWTATRNGSPGWTGPASTTSPRWKRNTRTTFRSSPAAPPGGGRRGR